MGSITLAVQITHLSVISDTRNPIIFGFLDESLDRLGYSYVAN